MSDIQDVASDRVTDIWYIVSTPRFFIPIACGAALLLIATVVALAVWLYPLAHPNTDPTPTNPFVYPLQGIDVELQVPPYLIPETSNYRLGVRPSNTQDVQMHPVVSATTVSVAIAAKSGQVDFPQNPGRPISATWSLKPGEEAAVQYFAFDLINTHTPVDFEISVWINRRVAERRIVHLYVRDLGRWRWVATGVIPVIAAAIAWMWKNFKGS
jgi:hypothetical protein